MQHIPAPPCREGHEGSVCLSDSVRVTELENGSARTQTQVFVDSKAHPLYLDVIVTFCAPGS